MYKYLGATDEDFRVFKAWVGKDAWTHKRWDAKGDMPGGDQARTVENESQILTNAG